MTIAKTTKRAAQLINSATSIKCFSLTNGFRGEPLTNDPMVWSFPEPGKNDRKLIHVTPSEFLRHELTLRSSKLSDDGNGKYSINVHSNLWFEFQGAL